MRQRRLHPQRELELVYEQPDIDLPALTPAERLHMEGSLVGVSTGPHLLSLYRPWLEEQGVLSSAALRACEDGQAVRVAGLVVVHQAPPTAKGFRFLTLEDEFGLADVIIRPQVYERYRKEMRGSRLLLVTGTLQREGAVRNVIAREVQTLSNSDSPPYPAFSKSYT